MVIMVAVAAATKFDDLTSLANQNDFRNLDSLIDTFLDDPKLATKAELHLRNTFS